MRSRLGFTLVEMLIVVGIIAVISGAGALSLVSSDPNMRLSRNTESIIALLRSAQERAINQEGSSRWGVYFNHESSGRSTAQVFQVNETLITTPGYTDIPGTPLEKFATGRGIQFMTPAEGSSLYVVFDQRTGVLETDNTVILETTFGNPGQKAITVERNGRIVID